MSENRELTRLSGIVSIVSLTVTTENRYANNVLPEGVLVKKSDNILYRTDGVHAIRDLIPVADQVLTSAEKISLSTAFSTDTYRIAPGGVVVHGSNGKINDSSLNVVESGKIKPSYLSDFIDNGIVKYAVLPDDVKNSFIVVNTYNDLRNVSAENRKKLVIVTDTSDDPANASTGNGIYYYNNNSWHSVIAVASTDVTYESVQAVSGIMYDHPLHIKTNDTNIRSILDALVIGEVADDPVNPDPDTPVEPDVPQNDETASPIQQSYETFITNLAAIYESDNPDVYVEQSQISDFVLRVDATNVFSTDSDLTITITDTVANLTASLPLAGKAYDNPNIRLAGYNYDDPMYGIIFENTWERETNVVTMAITDGTKTAIFNTTAGGLLDAYNLPEAIITIDTANGWSITN